MCYLLRQTGVALGIEVDDKMPEHEYYEYFGPDYTLHVAPSNMENKNTRHLLDNIRSKLLENLSKLQHAPSVQFQERPPDADLGEVNYLTIFFLLLSLFHTCLFSAEDESLFCANTFCSYLLCFLFSK